MSLERILLALQHLLQQISIANGFKTDLEGRVYMSYFPEDAETGVTIRGPYITMALVGGESFEPYGTKAMSVQTTINLCLLVPETARDVRETTAVPAIAKLRDDVIRILLSHPDLGLGSKNVVALPMRAQVNAGVRMEPEGGQYVLGVGISHSIDPASLAQ